MDKFTVEGSMRRSRRHEDGAARCWAVGRKLVLGLSLALACQTALAQATYRIKPLGYLGGCASSAPVAYGFNGADQVTGQACKANGYQHAFLWKNDGKPLVDLGPDEVGSTSAGYSINASGLVAGGAQDSTGTYGFVSSGNGAPMTRIPDGFGGTLTYAYGVNDSGQVTGEAENPSAPFAVTDAFLWKDDGSPMRDIATGLPNSYGLVINASGQVAGAQYDGDRSTNTFIWLNGGSPTIYLGAGAGIGMGPCCINASGQVAGNFSVEGYAHPHAFVWRNDGTGMHDLGTLVGGSLSQAYAQNDSGQVAGASWVGYFKKERAFVWMNNGTPMKNLGTFGGTDSQSNDINASGQVTGWANTSGDAAVHAFLWRNNGTKIQDLNTLIDPTDPLKPFVTLTSGAFINAPGDIVAEGTDSRTGKQGLYVLQGTVLALAPRSLAFGNQPINTKSAAKSVTMTNTSAKVVAINSIALNGTAAAQFASINNCGSSLVGHATCTITVTFKPTTKGAKSATLNVNGGGGGLRTVTLTGTGT